MKSNEMRTMDSRGLSGLPARPFDFAQGRRRRYFVSLPNYSALLPKFPHTKGLRGMHLGRRNPPAPDTAPAIRLP